VELIQAGYEPIIVDSLENSYLQVLDGIEKITGIRPEFHKVNLRIKKETEDFFNTIGNIDGVIHFAAFKAVGESVSHPLSYYENNLNSLIYLIQEMVQRGIKNIVFSSSCTVYAQPDQLPVSEQAEIRKPYSPYGNTKKISEEIIEDAVNTYPLNAISLRYFNPIGAHPSACIGELPQGIPNNLMPYITQTAKGIRKKITVFGNDYPTPDGTCVRDYIHVVDLAKAHVIAIERLVSQKNTTKYEVFNLGTGRGYTVLEVIHAFERQTGIKLNYEIGPRRSGDVAAIYADTSFATNVLGWVAERDIDNMVITSWRWEENIRNIYGSLFN
jgi:UDP-glucose 4-epimerase